MHPHTAQFVIGIAIGAVLWGYWTAPMLGVIFTVVFVLCILMARFRLVTAFVLGLIIGFS